ncbi:hypothetical protein PspLS_08584 [Pyricularia sp. CBS 133598]|nr:hypothetical protein PspLS_08584 [Pyricularia sp. CBS 133598]
MLPVRCVLEALRLLHNDGMYLKNPNSLKKDILLAPALPAASRSQVRVAMNYRNRYMIFWQRGKMCEPTALRRMHKFFGPFPPSYGEFDDPEVMDITNNIRTRDGPPAKPFARVTSREIPLAGRDFILRIMKLDLCDRPTAEELLADTWFTGESKDTCVPLPNEIRQPEPA